MKLKFKQSSAEVKRLISKLKEAEKSVLDRTESLEQAHKDLELATESQNDIITAKEKAIKDLKKKFTDEILTQTSDLEESKKENMTFTVQIKELKEAETRIRTQMEELSEAATYSMGEQVKKIQVQNVALLKERDALKHTIASLNLEVQQSHEEVQKVKKHKSDLEFQLEYA